VTLFAFVFARGGSKGVPRKNVRELGGSPLIAHSIRTARELSEVDGIFVSTDCDEIAQIAQEYGAEVIRRPAELATDTASEWAAWRHAVNYLEEQGRTFDLFLSLPATSPLRARQDVEACLNMMDAETDVVITVTPSARSPYFNMVKRTDDGRSEIVIGGTGVSRRQDAPQVFDMTTVAYLTRPGFIKTRNSLFDGVVRSVVVPKHRAVDIDDEIDFQLAELLYARGQQ